jgi:RHS repeat-associated protein
LVQGWLYQDQLRPVAQLDGSNNVVARFVYGSKANVPDYMITSGGTYRILSDHLGSPRAVVDVSSGNLIETIHFDEFGNETDTIAGTLPTGYVRIPFGFAGGMYDPDTGLVRFGARDYDASVGRWTRKDPVLFGGGQNNIYVYTGNDPVNLGDPAGTGPQQDWEIYCFLFGCGGQPPVWPYTCPPPPDADIAACAACQAGATAAQIACIRASNGNPYVVAGCLALGLGARAACGKTVCKSSIQWAIGSVTGNCGPPPACKGQ